jgi:hypothetical protein
MTMHGPKPYKCSICGAEVPDLPMPSAARVPDRAVGDDEPANQAPSAPSAT